MALTLTHRFVPGAPGAPTLLLLHGTGGDENDLLPVGEMLLPGAARLSPRGQVLENGMPRFFRRLAEGVFDLDDLRRRARELAEFVSQARREYPMGDEPPIAVGFSNGANIAAAVLLLHPGTLGGGLLLRPMVPLVPKPLPDLAGVPVAILAGRADPLIDPGQSEQLAELLRRAGAAVTLEWVPGGHGLTRADLTSGPGGSGMRWGWLESRHPSVFLLFRGPSVDGIVRTTPLQWTPPGRGAAPCQSFRRPRRSCRSTSMRAYVMLSAALEHERLLIAERLLSEIERRHGLPHPIKRDIHPVITDRFLATYLPEAREGEPAPLALEYAFAPNLSDALRLLQEVVSESGEGRGAAMYIYDLDTGLAADTNQPN